MKFRLCAARLINRSAFLALLLCAMGVQAQVSANPSADGAFAGIASPNLSATPDASQGVSSESGSGRSLLRQQALAGNRATSSRALTSASRSGQQKAPAALYTANGLTAAGTSTSSAPRSLYGGISTPPVSSIGFKSGVGRGLGTGLSSGFSTSTLLGSSPGGGVHPSSMSSVSGSRSSGKEPSTGSSSSSSSPSSRGAPLHGAQGKSRLEGLSQKYTFQAPRSRYDKAAPESSFRSRRLADQQ